jgi:hypothetical protein
MISHRVQLQTQNKGRSWERLIASRAKIQKTDSNSILSTKHISTALSFIFSSDGTRNRIIQMINENRLGSPDLADWICNIGIELLL